MYQYVRVDKNTHCPKSSRQEKHCQDGDKLDSRTIHTLLVQVFVDDKLVYLWLDY